MEHRNPTAETLVRRARDGEYSVPEFQRGFVWRPSQVLDFADSLVRGYPVGSILTWNSDTAVQRADGDDRRSKSWIIDGQQRITALCTLFGVRPDWWDDNKQIWSDHMASFDVRLDIGQEDFSFAIKKQRSARFVPVTEILKTNFAGIPALSTQLAEDAREYSKRTKVSSRENQRLANLDVGVLNAQLYQILAIKSVVVADVEIDDKIDLSAVAEIFTRLNTSGTRVQQSDIYLGVLASQSPGWVNCNFLAFLNDLQEQDFEIAPAFLFRAFTAIGDGKTRFREISPGFWKDPNRNGQWDSTKKAMMSVCQGFRQYGIVNSDLVLSLNAIVAAAIYRAEFPEGSFGPFMSWMLRATHEGYFSAATETRLDRVINAVTNADSVGDAIDALEALLEDPSDSSDISNYFKPSDFIDASSGRNSVARLMIYLLAYKNDAEDWNTDGYKIRAEATGMYRPEWHHIFPRKWLSINVDGLDKKYIDTVANMAVVSGDANRKIAAKAPSQYMEELQLVKRGLLIQQAIPDPQFVAPEQYRDWLDRRAEMLAREANKYLRELQNGD